jgi:hypothetical protein
MFRVSALLLLVALSASLPGAQAFAFSASQNDHSAPAGCHESAPASPSQQPVSHECCVNGHRWAVPSSSIAPHPLISAFLYLGADEGFLRVFRFVRHSALSVVSASPPGTSPLRI